MALTDPLLTISAADLPRDVFEEMQEGEPG